MMSEKTAKTYTHASNRIKRGQLEKKVAYKGVLDNAFRIQWPSIPLDIQNIALNYLLTVVGPRSRVQSRNKSSVLPVPPDQDPNRSPLTSESLSSNSAPQNPARSGSLLIGINDVTKQLENQISDFRTKLTISNTSGVIAPEDRRFIKVVFVCRADVDPPILVNHLPHLVAAFNSIRGSPCTLLVPLPQGAESSLAQRLTLRRAAVIALYDDFPNLSTLLVQLESIPVLSASWLSVENHTQLIPTHIKQLKTTAPKDMKTAKEQRASGRSLAKSRSRLNLKLKAGSRDAHAPSHHV